MSPVSLRLLSGALTEIAFDVARLEVLEREQFYATGTRARSLKIDIASALHAIEDDMASACRSLGFKVEKIVEPAESEAA